MPIVRDELNPKISMWHFLAHTQRFWREKEELSLTQCGKIMGLARSTVSNMEAGRRRPQDDQMRLLDEHYGTGVLFRMLLWFARMAHDPDWGKQIAKYEEQATMIWMWHGQVIPIALQTDDYSWAYVRAGSPKDYEASMQRRVARKRRFLDRVEKDELEIWALVDEAVLARQVGSREVMKAQMEHLLSLADIPGVILRVVPFSAGAHLGVDGSVQIIRLDGRDIAYAGAQNGGRMIESPGEVRDLSVKVDRVGCMAASVDGSKEIIGQYLERYS
ncbi:helix-turn-helix domain-containing protein [Actinomadura harenae]|uniref:XRE family transcriptional regulator n=1 Tax=Actinomadura harenae TaxID=2483351 RepID=A0A3M2M2L0_9ACTN|nr:helix-turn-helix transcriptional regulator [Actinomadura harenae]RMI43043.1 XRE family transcriptional regulator [Actinomadura harenae]